VRHRRSSSKNTFVNGLDGSFASVRLTRDHVTICVEGRDQDGPSVAGMSLSLDGVDRLLTRLTNVRAALARRLAKPLDIARAATQDKRMSNH
jgi:hypothetical protein